MTSQKIKLTNRIPVFQAVCAVRSKNRTKKEFLANWRMLSAIIDIFPFLDEGEILCGIFYSTMQRFFFFL